jgi:Ras-related protein Rab-1A
MAEEYDYLFKSIVVGDGGVGKTALTLRFSKGFFTEDYKMTIGVDFHVKTISIDTANGSIRCKLQLWDTGGQERFSSIRPMYYRGSLGVVLVFDLTNSDSFEHLPQWIEEVRANVKAEIPLLLVGNKSDLIDQRIVSMDEINRFTRDFNLYYMETSAKTGDGVGDCFYILACLMVGQGVPEQLIANSTVFAPGKITTDGQEMAYSSVPKVPSKVEFGAPSVTEPDETLEYEAPPVPEPEGSQKPQKMTFFTSLEDLDYEAPPVPEPAETKREKSVPKEEVAPLPKIELPEQTDFEFKMPDDIITEKAELEVHKAKSPLYFESKPSESAKYVPKSVPFSSNIPTPAPPPKEFQPTEISDSSKKSSTQLPPSQEIEEESDSLIDYMPDVILSKKEKKRKAKEQKRLEKQKAKEEKEKQKQDKYIEDKKKPKKDKKEKVKIEAGTSSLFQTLTARAEEQEELPKKIIPFIAATQETKEPSSSKLRIIPNIADIEQEPISPSQQEIFSDNVKPNSKELLVCEQCGAILSADYAFCNKCGHKL